MENKTLLQSLCLKHSLLGGSCKSPVVQQLRGRMFLCFSCRSHMFQAATKVYGSSSENHLRMILS